MIRSLRYACRFRFARQKELFSVVNSVLHPGICYMTHVTEERFKFLKNYGIDEMVISSSIKDHQIGENSELRFIDPDFQKQARELWNTIYQEEQQNWAKMDDTIHMARSLITGRIPPFLICKEKISETEKEDELSKNENKEDIPSTRRAIAWKNLIRDEDEKIFPKIIDPALHKTLFGYPMRKRKNGTQDQITPDPTVEEEKTEESDLENPDKAETKTETETETKENSEQKVPENNPESDTSGKTASLDIGCLAGVDLSQMHEKFPNINLQIKELRCKKKVQILEEVDVTPSLLKVFLTAKVDKRIEKLSIQYDSYKSFHTKNDTTMPSEIRQKSAQIEGKLKKLKTKRDQLETNKIDVDELLDDFQKSGLTMIEFESKSLSEVFQNRRARVKKLCRTSDGRSSLWNQYSVEELKFKEHMVALQALIERFNTKYEKIDHPGLPTRISIDFPIQTHIEAMNQFIGLFMKNNIMDEWCLEQILRNTEYPLANIRFLVDYFQLYRKKHLESIQKFPGPNKIPNRDYTDRTNEQLLEMIEDDEKESIKSIFHTLQARIESGDNSRKGKLLREIQKEIDTGRFPENIEKMLINKMKDLREMKDNEPDFSTMKILVENFLKLPFGKFTKPHHTLIEAGQILDASHHGMEDLKKRILHILAISKLKSKKSQTPSQQEQTEQNEDQPESQNPETDSQKKVPNKENPAKILCLHGPPGTGKTSVAKAIAKSYDRQFTRISLGGDNDVSLIKGHHRGYVSSQPGKIIKAMIQAGSMNPVILLDEVDKISGIGYQGGIYDVLLEVLDPVQNFQFKDNFMEEPIDLSQVLFICSANVVNSSKMGQAFVDRMELIEVSGYTLEEKQQIFKDHIFPKNLLETGLVKSKDNTMPEIEENSENDNEKTESDIITEVIDGGELAEDRNTLMGDMEIQKDEPETQSSTVEQDSQQPTNQTPNDFEENDDHEEDSEKILRQFEGFVVKVEFSEEAILTMINDYSREPGVRGIKKLSRKIMDKIAQHVAVTIVEGRSESELEFDFKPTQTGLIYRDGAKEILYQINSEHVNNILGQSSLTRDSLYPGIMKADPDNEHNSINSDELVGVTMMPMSYYYGGSIDFVEVVVLPQESAKEGAEQNKFPTKYIDSAIDNIIFHESPLPNTDHLTEPAPTNDPAKIQITGSAGQILKETVNASLSFARHFLYRSFHSKFLETKSLHVHFPAGGTAINCPSAGLAVVSSLISLALKQPVRPGVGMAGEVSLNGKVSGVNGLKERLLAMKREGIHELVLSEENRGEVEDFKNNIKEGIRFHFVKDYMEAFSVVFEND